MTAATVIAEAFGEEATSDLYDTVLRVPSDATTSQLRRAYHKRALQFHPDKISSTASQEEVDEAKIKFQAVSVTYQILSDADRRREYDETGEILDEGEDGDFAAGGSEEEGFALWKRYFEGLFGSISFDDIDRFAARYKCSDEEEADVLKYYRTCKGDLDKMVSCVMCSDPSDKGRWLETYIEPAIERGDVERYEALSRTMGDNEKDKMDVADECVEAQESDDETETEDEDDAKKSSNKKIKKQRMNLKAKRAIGKRKKVKLSKKEREAEEAEQLIAKIRGKNSGNSLARRREEAFDDLITNLHNRYSDVSGKKKGKGGGASKKRTKPSAVTPDIPDDDFERIQRRLNHNRKSKKRA